MKVIFLDNDGVICLSNNWGSRFKKQNRSIAETVADKDLPVEFRFDNFDQKAVKVLNEILEETEAEIVVSSDWKHWANLKELSDYYEAQGIIKRPIAITPNLEEFDSDTACLFNWKGWYERKRILEIDRYLELHPEITHWVAVDDLNMSPGYNQGHGLENFILTPKSTEGIKQCGIKEKILSFLKQN
jgi:hypothetical protein